MSHDFIGNENIFEVIGNQPVLDQYDVLYSLMQSGSMYDDYITGSLFTRTRILNVTTVTFGERGVAFSKLGVDKNALPSSSGMSLSYASQPWRERAGVTRFVKHLSDSERYYDTLLPKLDELVEKDGTYLLAFNNNVVFAISQTYVFSYIDNVWIDAYPFEARYNGIQRIKKFSSSFTAQRDITGSFVTPVTQNKLQIEEYFYDNPSLGGILWRDSTSSNLYEADAAKIIFGYGDSSYTHPISNDVRNRNRPTYRSRITSGSFPITISPIIRGWKYGICDGMPRYSNAIFRRDRFGQLRDMLEQRSFAKYIDDAQNAPFRRYDYPNESPAFTPNLPSSQTTIPEAPVTVSFVEPQIIDNKLVYTSIPAIDSQASNLSLQCTSSLPYFDGLSRNR